MRISFYDHSQLFEKADLQVYFSKNLKSDSIRIQLHKQEYNHDSRKSQSKIDHVWSNYFLTITQISCTNTFLSFERKGSSFSILVGSATLINIFARIGISFCTRVSWTTFMDTELFLWKTNLCN